MPLDRFDYSKMVQDAYRSVVRQILEEVAESGLPGVHHFYMTYSTTYPGVSISPELLQKYPDQITIVLQHDYRDLTVEEDRFSVVLHFGGLPQRIVVPWKALVAFYDPSEQFVMRFDLEEKPEPSAADGGLLDQPAPAGSLQLPVRAVLQAADRMQAAKEAESEPGEDDSAGSAPSESNGPEALHAELEKHPAPVDSKTTEPAAPETAKKGSVQSVSGDGSDDTESSGSVQSGSVQGGAEEPDLSDSKPGNVVSIDAFRRK